MNALILVFAGPSKEPQQRLVDDPVIDPTELIKQGADILNLSYADCMKKNEEVAAQKEQSTSVQTESVKEMEPEGVARDDSSETNDESTETEKELDLTTLGHGKAQMKKKPTKKKKVEVQQKEGDVDNEVEVTGVRDSTPPPPPPLENVEIPESSRPKNAAFPDLFGDLHHASGVYKDDILDEDFDMFNNAVVKTLEKKVSVLEQEKAKAEAEKIKKLKDGVHDNSQLFEILSAENVEMREQMRKLQEVNQMLNGLISDLHEATSNDMKAVKLEMEAMKADKVMKDEQLNMLYTVMESHLNIDVHSVFGSIEIKRAEERWVERERRLAEEATQRRKGLVVDTEETLGSSSQPAAGGSSSLADVEIVDVEDIQAQGFVLVGESFPSLNFNDIIRRVLVEQRIRKVKEPEKLLLKWKEEEEVVEVVEEEEEEVTLDDDLFDIDNYPEGNNDDDDQGSSGLLIVNASMQQKIEDFLNDEINEQEENHQQESSSYGNQQVDQVFLTQPTIIYLHACYEGELEVPRSIADMLEELGLDDGKFKFNIEDEIPPSPEREYEFKYAQKANQYNDVIVEEASDSFDEETDYHYSGVDEMFPSLTVMFKDHNEDEIRRNIIEKITTEGVPRTIPIENLKVYTATSVLSHDAHISWGDILSWGYLEDFQVYAIRREQGVQYFEFLSDIKTLPWWDIDELVQRKNIKQFYHGLDVKQHDQHLWDYVKQQSKARYPDWKPQYLKQIVTILENGEKMLL
ncbi:hypothetical protein Hanom_Chr16g01464251 [Helianthus anomalus]